MPAETAVAFPSGPRLGAHIDAEVQLPGAHVQLASFSWENSAHILTEATETTIRWRVSPTPVGMTAGIGEGAQSRVGRLMVSQPGETWHWVGASRPESVKVLQCHLGQNWLEEELADEASLVSSVLGSSPDFHDVEIDTTMRCIATELAKPAGQSIALIRCWLTALALQLARHAKIVRPQSGTSADQLSVSAIKEIEHAIRSSERILRTSDVAKLFGMSARHLRRMFKQSTGRTIYEAIEDDRLYRAYNLLRDTDMRLKVVSYMLGYGNQSTFSYAFKKSTGISPMEFRRTSRAAC